MKAKQLLLAALAVTGAGSMLAQTPIDVDFGVKGLSLRRTVEAELTVFANPDTGFFPWTGGFWDGVFLIGPGDVVLSDTDGDFVVGALFPDFSSDENRDGFQDMTFLFDMTGLLANEVRRTEETFTLTVTKTTFLGTEVFQGSTTIKLR